MVQLRTKKVLYLGFKGDFIVNGVAGTPRWESQTCCERAHFVRLQVRYLHRDEIPTFQIINQSINIVNITTKTDF